MLVREQLEQREEQWLSPLAARSAKSLGRLREDVPCRYRTAFQRDRDRVIHCKSFRRLKHKTQVFLSPEGDHYRTRLTHTLEVAQIARTIARALALNEDLTEAIALAHDLGHTPFGHAGERTLDQMMPGGFRHYEQSLRTVDRLENDGRGLNLTHEVRDGVLKHTRGDWPDTLEGCVVRVSDRVAYSNHDVDDAIRAGVLTESDIPADIRRVLGDRRTTRIDTIVTSIVENSTDEIRMADDVGEAFEALHEFLFEALYHNPVAKSEESKVTGLLGRMFEHFVAHPDQIPEEFAVIRDEEGAERAACDYIAGMTDNYALEIYHNLFIPRGWTVKSI
ncbi:MAG: deoxyguanosinetriphosphate triphosphohydrolase [Acutalibacteraceae bacterium]|jgi:dGTPase